MNTRRSPVIAWATLTITSGVFAQSYPTKPIRLVVAGPAAGGADVIARPVAQKLSESLGQQVIVDNRPGAGTLIAGQITAGSPPDGYTLLLGTVSTMCISPMLAQKPPFDSDQDFVPVTLLAAAGLMITVHPSLSVKSVKELITLAKTRPNKLLYASNGAGSLSHLTTELFSRAAGISMVHVPYKGGSPAVLDTIGGHTQLVITAIPTLIAQVKASKLRALAVTSSRRSNALPDLPTVAESGLVGFESTQWYAVFAPKNTPTMIVDKLYAELGKAADNSTVKVSLAQEGAELSVGGPQALANLLRTDSAKWKNVIRESIIALE
jgi:tripartite-type tricarboxylate transporter receptor subunit TctC